MTYKFLSHTADIKFQASGNSIEKAFEESALALTQSIAEDIKVKPKIKKSIKVKGKDNESLLYNFLEEFLYLLDAKDFLLSEIEKINIKSISQQSQNNHLINNGKKISKPKVSQSKTKGFQLTATLTGDKASDYKFTNDVKAITYNDMFVKKQKNKFICQVVLDV